jgi:hypothetical protein
MDQLFANYGQSAFSFLVAGYLLMKIAPTLDRLAAAVDRQTGILERLTRATEETK